MTAEPPVIIWQIPTASSWRITAKPTVTKLTIQLFARLLLYLQGRQHAARNQYQEPEVHVEKLGDFIGHIHGENQEEQAHAEAAEVFPDTPEVNTNTTFKNTPKAKRLALTSMPLPLPVAWCTQG